MQTEDAPLPTFAICWILLISLYTETSFYTLHANTPWIQDARLLIQLKPGGEGGKVHSGFFSGSCQLTCEAS